MKNIKGTLNMSFDIDFLKYIGILRYSSIKGEQQSKKKNVFFVSFLKKKTQNSFIRFFFLKRRIF